MEDILFIVLKIVDFIQNMLQQVLNKVAVL